MKDYRPEANHLLLAVKTMKEDEARAELIAYLENADNNGFKRKELLCLEIPMNQLESIKSLAKN